MHWIDISVILAYLIVMLGVGIYFLQTNKDEDDYYVGGRKMGSLHIGLSVVATDVGGGFSIGLGGLGFIMGLSGSWMLFSGLLGAWLAAVLLIPKVSKMGKAEKWLTFPQFFLHHYGTRVALIAAIISGIGYLGFTSSQILAGAKLASASIPELDLGHALIIMGVVSIVYTVFGGLKAVIYTDTIQWALLMGGLVFIGIPLGYMSIGGIESIRAILPAEFLSLSNLKWSQMLNWMVTIVPIWFIGMTLYQRIFACRDIKVAKRAWFMAGLFEFPVMAFMGVLLGLFARVAAEQGMFAELGYSSAIGMDEELGLPMLLRSIMPVGLMGLMLAAYFSAIMSTADSCLMAASGNLVTDIFGKAGWLPQDNKGRLRLSQAVTLIIGLLALGIASMMQSVLDLMLMSYSFMVSGLFVPVIGILWQKKPNHVAALWAMLSGGVSTLLLIIAVEQKVLSIPFELDPILPGILISALIYLIISSVKKNSSNGTKY